MFERRDDVMTVAAESAMIPVVHHHNVATRLAWARNARESLDKSLRRLRLPIPTDFRPHDDALNSRAMNF
jgi:hypothetical protein